MNPLLLSACVFACLAVSVVGSSAPGQTSHGLGKILTPRPAELTATPEFDGGPIYPVGGNIWPIAVYYMYINVGTPPLPYCVAIDTGSTTAAVSDASCTTCSQNPVNYNYYNTSKSSTSKLVQQGGYGGSYETCNFADPGADCTDSGDLYADTTAIGTASLPGYQIGSMTYVSSNFDQFKVCGGIMGLFGDTLFSELVTAGAYTQNQFGICLSPTEGAQANGTINFGGISEELYTGEIQWTKNTDGFSFYQVQVESAEVFGQTISSFNGQAILDSGTNVILVEQNMYTDFQSAFVNSCKEGSNLHGICDVEAGQTLWDGPCYPFTSEQIAAYPDITVNLNNVTLSVSPQAYLNQYDPLGSNPDYYCIGFRVSTAGFIVGDVLMANYYVIFDNVGLNIGWATASETCGAAPMPAPIAAPTQPKAKKILSA